MSNPELPVNVSPEQQERETLILTLSAGNERARSWLDTLSLLILRALTPESIPAALKNSAPEAPAMLQLPAPIPTPPPPTPSIPPPPGATSSAASLLTPEVLSTLLQLSSDSPKLPSHYILPPVLFGTSNLTTEEESKLGSLRKDTKNAATLESCLRWALRFCKEHPHVSEASIIASLHVLLPLHCLKDLEFLRMQQRCTLRSIFDYLQTHHASTKSRSEVFRSLSRLTAEVGDLDPLSTLEKISHLLLQVTDDPVDCENAALRESLSYLKLILGEESFLTLQMFLKDQGFAALYRICKSDFADLLHTRYREKRAEMVKKIRRIEDRSSSLSDIPHSSSTTASASLTHPGASSTPCTEIERVLRQILEINGQVNHINPNLHCYLCGEVQHFVKDCPLNVDGVQEPPPRQPNPIASSSPQRTSNHSKISGKAPYTTLPCFLHPRSTHTNSDCFKQRAMPCATHGGHHSSAECQRMTSPDQSYPRSQSRTRQGASRPPKNAWQQRPQPQTWSPFQAGIGNSPAYIPSSHLTGSPVVPQPWRNNHNPRGPPQPLLPFPPPQAPPQFSQPALQHQAPQLQHIPQSASGTTPSSSTSLMDDETRAKLISALEALVL